MTSALKSKFCNLSLQFQKYLNGEAEFTEKEQTEAHWRRISLLAFVFVVFLVGIPVWCFTTTIYRAPLPRLDLAIVENLERRLGQYLPNQRSVDVWDNLELHSDYNVHFIFVHNELKSDETALARQIQQKIEAFSRKFFKPIGVEIEISSEHLWDFTLDDFIASHAQRNSIDSNGQLPATISTELDRLCSPPIGREILLKIAIFFNANNATRFVHAGAQTADALSIASWGGLFLHNGRDHHPIGPLLDAIISTLHLQFSIPLQRNGQKMEQTYEEHKQRLAIENLLKTAQILNSLHELASKIEDLIISDEVSAYAAESEAEFLKAYTEMMQNGQIDSASAAQSRRLANRANGHHSLLELLNFPSDQKYGIYVPLFLPLLVPILQPLALFFLFLLSKLKKKKADSEIIQRND